MNIIRHRTPDTGWAWVISASIGAINGLTFGLIRSFGVYFFYLRQEFDISRQVASWPFALCTSCTYLTGPITGFLISYFHLRTIVCVGILFTSFGFAACFFVTDISQIVILVGVVHGFGIGLSYMQTPVIIAQYFDKYTATATAISYAGGTVGSFIFPAIIESSIATYGLKGSFLIIGAILLNGLPCAMLLRPPIPDNTLRSQSFQGESAKLLSTRSIRGIHNKLKRKRSEKWMYLRKSSIELFVDKLNTKNNQTPVFKPVDILYQDFNALFTMENIKSHKKQARTMGNQFSETEVLVMESTHTATVGPSNRATGSRANSAGDELTLTGDQPSSRPKVLHLKNKYCQTVRTAKRSHFGHAALSIIRNPMYIILLITHVSFQWAWMTYQMVIFDFSMDQDLSRSQSVSILISFAISDLFGRIISGWVADKQIIKKNHIVSICILCIGFFIQLTSMITSYRTHLTLTLFLGFTCGVIIVLFNLLTMEYVGLSNLPVALGLSAFCVGVTSLARPYVIGLFRDVIGSYIGLFRFVGTLSFFAALLWLMEPFAILNFKRRSNFKQTSTDPV